MPDVPEIPDDIESIASTAGDDTQIEMLLAGFRACAKEAIRFLLEEEGLAPDHELPVGLQEHLDRQQSHLAGMLQNDSGLETSGMNASFGYSSADDDESFATAETSDIESSYALNDMTEDSSIHTNASSSCLTNTECLENESLLTDSGH